MPDAPLSRRARRALEAQAAERAAGHDDPARESAEGVTTGEIPAADNQGRPISRRDRRRLERLARPMESWTAEEEMIATGQIPAMTPERIAEQERLAREAAQKAAEDAQTASQELRILAQRDIERQGSAEAPEQDEWTPSAEAPEPAGPVPSADVPLVQPALMADDTAPPEEREIVEPYSPQFDFGGKELRSPREESADVRVPAEFDPHAKIERTPAPTGDPAHANDGDSGAWPNHDDQMWAPSFGEVGAQTEPERVTEPEPVVEPEPEQDASFASDEAATTAARAKVFEELFPPGSSQAELLESDRLARESAAESARASIANNAQQFPQETENHDESERQRGIEEIRRLTEAAISGIERKPLTAEQADQGGQAEAVEHPTALAPQPEAAHRYEMPGGADEDSREFLDFRSADTHVDAEHTPASPMPNPGALAPPSGQFPTVTSNSQEPGAGQLSPSAPAPHHATFDEAERTASTEIPVRPANAPSQAQPPSPWDSHPLDAAQPANSVDVNDFQPVTDVPRPDFSQLNTRPAQIQFPPVNGQGPANSGQFPATSGQFPTTSGQFATDPTATGQIAPIRRVPDLPPVGGAKHFRWHHLAVIGALVFVLGVVIYNVWLGK